MTGRTEYLSDETLERAGRPRSRPRLMLRRLRPSAPPPPPPPPREEPRGEGGGEEEAEEEEGASPAAMAVEEEEEEDGDDTAAAFPPPPPSAEAARWKNTVDRKVRPLSSTAANTVAKAKKGTL